MKVTLPRSVLLPSASTTALWLPRPGTRRGPCIGPCVHPHCTGMRHLATMPCSICGGALGWETPLYQFVSGSQELDKQVRLIHGLCMAMVRYPGQGLRRLTDSTLLSHFPDGSTRNAALMKGQVIVAKPTTHQPANRASEPSEVIVVKLKSGNSERSERTAGSLNEVRSLQAQ